MMEKYIIKLEGFIQKSCRIVEIAAALLILVGILLSIFGILKDFMVFFHQLVYNKSDILRKGQVIEDAEICM